MTDNGLLTLQSKAIAARSIQRYLSAHGVLDDLIEGRMRREGLWPVGVTREELTADGAIAMMQTPINLAVVLGMDIR